MKEENKKKKMRAMIIIIICLVGWAVILLSVITENISSFDDIIRIPIYGLRNEDVTIFMKAITLMGNWEVVIAICLMLLILKKTIKTYGIPIVCGTIAVTIINNIIKVIVKRPRPDDIVHLVLEHSYSFPSGHSITSMFLYGMMIYLIYNNMQSSRYRTFAIIALLIPALGVGVSRIYLGVHYPSDVLAGWLLGIVVIASIVICLLSFFSDSSIKENTL